MRPSEFANSSNSMLRLRVDRIALLQVFFFIFAIAASFGGLSSLVNLAYTPLALLLGMYLFGASSPNYLSYCMALWMYTPFIRRLVDYHTGYHEQSVPMLAPFVVSSLCLLSVRKLLKHRLRPQMIPYLVIFAVILYGFLIGLFQSGPFAAVYAALTWLSPLFLAFHILTHPEDIEANANSVFKTFSLGALLMGVYGLYQFFLLPEWDKYWIANANMGAIGAAAAASVRLFSTMNSPGVFALFLVACILTAFTRKGMMKTAILAIAITALMLSLVRSAWLCFLIAFMFTLVAMPWNKRMRYIVAIAGVAIVSLPLLLMGPIAGQIQTRLQSLDNLGQDASFQARSSLYSTIAQRSVESITGSGLGQTGTASRLADAGNGLGSIDSGFIDLFHTFGIFSFIFLLCMALIVFTAMRRRHSGPKAQLSAAICLSLALQMIFANILYAPMGVLFFTFSSIAIAYGQPLDRPKSPKAQTQARSDD